MQAIVYDRYGPPEVLHLQEVATPEPRGDQVRIRIRRVSVNAPDWRLLRARPAMARLSAGLLRPHVHTLGSDVAGTVDALGDRATHFRVGDDVFGDLAQFGYGGFAEYVCVPERAVTRVPVGVSFDDAAATPMAGGTALRGLRDHARLRPGQKVLVAGASGGVGTFALQIAKRLGAHVTAVCSTGKCDLARRLGADRVLDYTKDDFAQGAERYDVVFAVNGYRPIRDYARVLALRGIYLMVGGEWPQIREALLTAPLRSLVGRRKFAASVSESTPADLALLGEWLADGRIAPVIDRHYPLREVPDAIRYVEQGHATGKVMIDVWSGEAAA